MKKVNIALLNAKSFVIFCTMLLLLPFWGKAQDMVWAKQMGGSNIDVSYGVAVDVAGNVYTTGYFFNDTIDFDPGPGVYSLATAGDYDIFISKLDAAGNFVWAKRIGGRGFDESFDIAVDVAGNVYTTGFFMDTVDFDPGPNVYSLMAEGQGSNVFISKLDAAGNFVWAKQINMFGSIGIGKSIAVDLAGNVYTAGHFYGSADFDPGPGVSPLTPQNGDEVFVSKLDASGNFVWARQVNTSNISQPSSIAVDGAGNVYTTGFFIGNADFDPGPNTAITGGHGIFMAKWNTAGQYVWARQITATSIFNMMDSRSIAVDLSGNVYTTGYFEGTIDADTGPGTLSFTSAGLRDGFIHKLDASGNFVWAKQLGSPLYDLGNSIATDSAGYVYTVGNFEAPVDFDPGPNEAYLLPRGVFVSKLDGAGNFVWADKLGNNPIIEFSEGPSLALGAGHIYVTGPFYGTVDLDPGANSLDLTSAGKQDIYVTKLTNACINPDLPVLSTTNLGICAGKNATLQISPGNMGSATSWQWYSGSCGGVPVGSGTSISVLPNVTTTYYVRGEGGCVVPGDCASVAVTVNALLIVNLGPDITLPQGQQTVLGTTDPGLTYLWSTGATTPTIVVNAMGTYSVTVTNSAGCTGTDMVVVLVTSSADDPNNKYSISITPNPALDILYVKCTGSATSSVQILDNLGRKLAAEDTFAADGTTRTLSLEKMPPGTYYVHITGEKFVRTVSVIKY